MTEKRFIVDKSGDFRDNKTGVVIVDFGYNFNGMECRDILELMNKLNDENEQLKKENKKLHDRIFTMRTNEALDRPLISERDWKNPKEFLEDLDQW